MYDAIVIGGGVVGASAAYHLAKAGARTLMIDRHHEGRATDAGAGILSPETNTRDGAVWLKFGIEAVNYYDQLIPMLEAEQADDTGYARCGRLTVAVSDDELEAFEEDKRTLLARQQSRGVPAPEAFREISAAEARKLFPALASVKGATYFRDAARVDGRLLTSALVKAAKTYGLMIINEMVDGLTIANGVVTGVEARGESYEAGGVIIAGGAWSKYFGRQLGVQIPVEPQRGQIIHLQLADTDTGDWAIITAYRGHYIVPWPNGRVVVGATRETGSGFEPVTTAGGVREVLSEALRVAPGLRDGSIVEIRVGLRPYTRDLIPVLGTVPGVKNIYLATGHGPTGLQLGPFSGKLMADMILGRQIETDLTPFRIERFG